MSYASVLSAFTTYKLDATLIVSGVPVVFGTRDGIVHDGVGINAPMSSLTSVNAIDAKSLRVGESAIDKDGGYIKPSQFAIEIRKDSSYNKWFERRRTPNPILTATLSETGATITVNSTTGLSNGDYLFINRETIQIGTVASSTSLTGCTRNAIGLASDSAASHLAGTTCGVTPRHLLGREAVLRVYVGESGTDYVDFAGLKLTASPRDNTSKNVWELAADDSIVRFAKKIAVGMTGAAITTVDTVVSSGEVYVDLTYDTGPGAEELGYVNNSDLGWVLLTAGENGSPGTPPVIARFTQVSNAIRVKGTSLPGGYGAYGHAKRVYVFQGNPIECALKVLLSDRGNGDIDATYDVLMGISSTGGSTSTGRPDDREHRLGAAIPAGLVDLATLTGQDLLSRVAPGFFYVLGGRGPENLLDLLEEIAWALQGYWYTNSLGKLSFKIWDAVYPTDTASTTITEGQLARDVNYVSVDDETDILHSVTIECNIPPDGDSPRGIFNSVWLESRETYRDVPGGTRTLKRRTLVARTPVNDTSQVVQGVAINPADLNTITGMLSRIFVKRAQGTRKYVFDCPWRYSTVSAGDIITVTHSKFNAFDGNGLNSATLHVLSRKNDYARQRVTLTCEETWSGRLFAPTARVASWSGAGPYTLTLSASNTKWNLGASPTSYFAVGWTVSIRQYSTGSSRYATNFNATITGISSGTVMTVTGVPYATPAAKDIVCFRDYDNAASTTANTAQSLGQHSYLFMCDSNFFLGAANDTAEVWG